MEFYKIALSDFIFQEKIGEGTQSRCFLATEKATKQKCAVLISCFTSSKISLIIDIILAQIKMLTKISCPIIPKMIDYNINISSKYINKIIITEFIPNDTLSHIISMSRTNNIKYKWTKTKKFINFYGIAYGMSYLHSLNIVHRDLTSKSILLDEYLYPKIVNFGSALDLNFNEKTDITDIKNSEEEQQKNIANEQKIDKNVAKERFNIKNLEDEEEDNENLIEKEENNEQFFEENLFEYIIHFDENKENLLGTPSYIAPEIYESLKYSKSSDVFSFSIILYEILTSQIPFESKANHQIARYVTEGGRPDLNNKEIPECYIELLTRCWNQEPSKRPTFKEVVTELRTNKKFMTELNVEEEEFENYRKLIEEKIKPKTEKIYIVKDEKKVDLSIEIEEIDLSKYKLDKLINQDSFSNVYKVIEIKTNNIYEAKISHKTIYEYSNMEKIAIKREIAILSKLKFPSIIKFIGYNKRNFSNHLKPTIITEYVEYQSLEEMIINLNETKKLINIYGIASGMSYLHSLNIIHRDLKPSNISLDEHLFPKIGNFKYSKEINKNENEDNKNIGTLLFMAPEILTENKYCKASDVYSFALVVYFILTSKKPYNRFKYIDIIKKVPEGIRPEFSSHIPICYKELIERCWSNDFNKRPTFDEIIQTIKTNPGFITDDVNKDEFLEYMKYIDEQSQIENDERICQNLFEDEFFEEEEEVSDDIKEESENDNYSEDEYEDINKKADDNKKESSKKIVKSKDYIEIEDKNSNYAEQIKKLNESIDNEDQVFKISFKFNASNNLFKEESSSDIDEEEKNELDIRIGSLLLEKEESEENQTKSKKAVKKRKKFRRKPKNYQDKIEQNKNAIIFNEEKDSEDEILEKEDDKIKKEEERIRKEKEERLKKEKEEKIRKEDERIRKEKEEKLMKEKEEQLRKEEERLKEEKLRKEKEEQLRKEEERLKEEKIRKEKEEKLRREEERRKEEKIRKEKEEKLRKEEERRKEEKIRKDKEEKLRKEEEKLKKEKEEKTRKEESIKSKDDKDKNFSNILSKYKDVEDVVIMQLEPTKKENRVSFPLNDQSQMKPKTANQQESSLNKSPRRPKDTFSDSKTKKIQMPPSQKTKLSSDNQTTIINPIKLTVTLKDIGMEKFDPKNQEIQQQKQKENEKEKEKQDQTKPTQNPQPTISELPKLNHYNKYSNPNQNTSNAQSRTENKLPRLIRDNNPTISMPNKQNQFNIKSPRGNRESSSKYDPSIFYSHSNNITINQNKSLMTRHEDIVKNPIKLKITLKDIGMESFDSTQDKTKKLQESEKKDNQEDGERIKSRRYQRP